MDREYFVKENVWIYYTPDMDQTLRWFEQVLGWNGKIFDRDDQGRGTYGFVSDIPSELIISGAVPFKGVHFWQGESIKQTVALIQVSNVDALYHFVTKNGWKQIGEIYKTGASPKTCNVKTIDGSILSFFE